jgi:uncharacterized membrane protein YqjE
MSHSRNSAQGDADSGFGQNNGQNTGLFAALKGIAATLLTTGRTRLELLGNEIEEGKLRALRLLLLAQAMIFCLGVGILLAVAWLALCFWESRLLVMGGFALLFILLGGVFLRAFLNATQRSKPLFASSLAELEEDLRQLKAAAHHEPATD